MRRGMAIPRARSQSRRAAWRGASCWGGATTAPASGRVAGAVLLEVRDRGPGIEPGAETAIFETFARGKGSDRSGDSGLGLAIVKGFADAMGIDVAAATDPDGGAVFTLTIPEEALVAA